MPEKGHVSFNKTKNARWKLSLSEKLIFAML